MIAQAVSSGARIGVIVTNPTTILPTQALLQSEAERAGKPVVIEMQFVENALAALLRGEADTHDRLVKQAVLELAERVDVIVLAQASIARVLACLARCEVKTPVLASPTTALEYVRWVLFPPSAEPERNP
jgi:hypothetical protein